MIIDYIVVIAPLYMYEPLTLAADVLIAVVPDIPSLLRILAVRLAQEQRLQFIQETLTLTQ